MKSDYLRATFCLIYKYYTKLGYILYPMMCITIKNNFFILVFIKCFKNEYDVLKVHSHNFIFTHNLIHLLIKK